MPTRPLLSPTTTMLPKANRRPPRTTLATRLIFTSRSSSSLPPSSSRRRDERASRLRSIPHSRMLAIAVGCPSATRLELETAFASSVSDCLHTPVIEKSTTIENDVIDSGGPGSLRDYLAHHRGAGRLLGALTGLLYHFVFEITCGNQCVAGHVVDHLSVDMG